MYKIPTKKESTLQVSAIVTGLTATVVQLIFLRTFLSMLNGNELIIGVILCNWMLLTGLGAMLGTNFRKPDTWLILNHLITGLLPALLIFGVLLLKSLYFPPGVLPSFTQSLVLIFFVMAPFCVLSGAMFTLLSVAWSQHALQNKTSRVYGIEAIGSILGSLIFVIVLIRIFSIPEILIIISSANLLVAILLSVAFGKNKNLGHLIFMGLLVWILFHFIFDWYGFAKSKHFKGQKILADKETPYGNLVVTKTVDQVNIFENGVSGFSSGDVVSHEESVHYALLQVSKPGNVLVISGQTDGIFDELKKYESIRVDFIEINPTLIRITEKYFGIREDSSLQIYSVDPVTFLHKTDKKYEAILLNIPPPASLQINRFYTTTFFSLLKSRMSPNGVLSLQPGGNSNYPGKEMLKFYRVLVSTIKQTFNEVLFIPGQSIFLLASDVPLSYEITKRANKLNIENQYVNQYYVDDNLLQEKGMQLMDQIEKTDQLNTNFKPVAFYQNISYWLSWYGLDIRWVTGIFILIFTSMILLIKLPAKALFVAGFTATSVEIMAMLTFQVMFGFLYEALAFLLAAFMAGLSAGTFFMDKYIVKTSRKYFITNQAIIGASALLIPLLILVNPGLIYPAVFSGLIYMVLGISGVITGAQFSMANQLAAGSIGGRASKSYSADLAGSAGGAIIAAVILIPLAGYLNTGIILAAMNIMIVIWLCLSRKSD